MWVCVCVGIYVCVCAQVAERGFLSDTMSSAHKLYLDGDVEHALVQYTVAAEEVCMCAGSAVYRCVCACVCLFVCVRVCECVCVCVCVGVRVGAEQCGVHVSSP